ncbi:Mitochondrial calcium uniporter regulator 1 [Trichoplax sp. H2]|nr:Mitochondrial calcium uniporter regulator 1 [Trichoplax sp. H2]|eukprot:RDD47694.1 Mitochondrial calcium uniporter regulator 1 [Trichoplax sp. H2]
MMVKAKICRILLRRFHTRAMYLQHAVTSSNVSPMEATTSISTSAAFDTLQFVKTLTNRGFQTQQAEVLSQTLNQVLANLQLSFMEKMVTKDQQDKLILKLNSDITSLRKDMFILEKSEFDALKNENEKLKHEVESIRKLLKDELSKANANFSLDVSMERSRQKEVAADQEQKIRNVNTKIETEIASLKTSLESHKLDVMKYLAGSFVSFLTIGLAVWRLIK